VLIVSEPQDPSTPLMVAAAKGHADAVQALLDAGADRNAAVRDHANILMSASDFSLPSVWQFWGRNLLEQCYMTI